MDNAAITALAKSLTKARRNMVVNANLGYGNCDHSMDGPGRRMLYALSELGILRQVNKHQYPEDRHTDASYVLSTLGNQVRNVLLLDKRRLSLSTAATAQIAMMTKAAAASLTDQILREFVTPGPNTHKVEPGKYITKVEGKRVLWRHTLKHTVEIEAIIDESYALSSSQE